MAEILIIAWFALVALAAVVVGNRLRQLVGFQRQQTDLLRQLLDRLEERSVARGDPPAGGRFGGLAGE